MRSALKGRQEHHRSERDGDVEKGEENRAVGAGFVGVAFTRHLNHRCRDRYDVEITFVSRDNFFVVGPLPSYTRSPPTEAAKTCLTTTSS